MALSTLSIQDLLEIVPRHLRRFSEPATPLRFANYVSKRLDKECEPRWTKKEAGLILVHYQTDYEISDITTDDLKEIKGIYQVPTGEITPDKEFPIRDSLEQDGKIRLEDPPNVSDDATDFQYTLPAATGSTTEFIVDTVASEVNDENNNFQGYLCRITYNATGKSVDRIIRKHEPENGKFYFNGKLDVAPDENDTYRILNEFYMVEYSTFFPKYTAMTDLLQVSEIFDPLYNAGMNHFYHQQHDKASAEAQKWEAEYERELERFIAFEVKMKPEFDNFRPRPIPKLFS